MCCAEPHLSLVLEAYAGGLQHSQLRGKEQVVDILGLGGSIAEMATRVLTGRLNAFCLKAVPQCRHIRKLLTSCLAPDWHADGPTAA